jgi:prevent-host-death family protein
MPMVTIKQLHDATGEIVRRAAESKSPLIITDHGKPIAVIANPILLKPKRRKERVLLPEFKALIWDQPSSGSSFDDLDAVRGDR